MWQPNRAQWSVIWMVVVLLALAWPPVEGRSLGVKLVNWLADPRGSLPAMPEPLPMGLGDDGNAVAAHDAQMWEYFRVRDSSTTARVRMRWKDATDPFDYQTERQVLIGVGVLAVLAVWKLGARQAGQVR